MALSEQELIEKQLQQQEQQMNNDPNAIHSDMLREERLGNILTQLNPDHLMEDIEHRIRGEKWDRKKGWIPVVDNQKPISDKLISNFMSFLGSILNQNTSMSNFSVDEINNLMGLIVNYIKNDLTDNDEEYDIVEDYPEMTRIGLIICISCFSTFKQALNGTMSRRIFGSLRVSGDLVDHKQPGIKEALNFWN